MALGVIHCLGRGTTIRAQAGMTAVKLGILAVLAVAGLAAGWGRWENLDDRPSMTPGLLVTMASSLVYISYAYTGWNAASYLAGEVDRPQERMPRAILLGTGLVLALYLALNTAYALALSAADVRPIVGGPEDVDADRADRPDRRRSALRPPRRRPAVGRHRTDAAGLAQRLHPDRPSGRLRDGPGRPVPRGRRPALGPGAPAIATALQVGWSLVLLWTASFERILLYSGVGLAIFSMLTVGSVYVLRRRRPDLPRPFRTPGYPLVPAVYLAGTGLLTAAVFYERPVVSSISLLSIAAGIPVYYISTYVAGRRVPAH